MAVNDSTIYRLLEMAAKEKASDIFIRPARPATLKKGAKFVTAGEPITPGDAHDMITGLYKIAERSADGYMKTGDDDFSVCLPGLARFRANAYRQRNTMAAVIRVVQHGIPDAAELSIPGQVLSAVDRRDGLVLVTGQTGSGKTTTLACMIDRINSTREAHIVTLENPIEYLHNDKKSLISQREIFTDTKSYKKALRASLREAPDVILLGEMRDPETIELAITAAETGQMVISTLHTPNAAQTVDRIIDSFPPKQQQQVRMQLSMSLKTVIAQKLIIGMDGNLIPAFEIMHVNSAISNIIREGKSHQIDNAIETSKEDGMISMDAYMAAMSRNGSIAAETAIQNAKNQQNMRNLLSP